MSVVWLIFSALMVASFALIAQGVIRATHTRTDCWEKRRKQLGLPWWLLPPWFHTGIFQ